MNHLPTKKANAILNVAKMLRRNMTPQEKHLWYDFLRHYPVKIYKQRIIDRFIADFYCHQARLVIEIDGSQHYSEKGAEHDQERTDLLKEYGISVLRFSNKDIDKCFDKVCHTIDHIIQERTSFADPL